MLLMYCCATACRSSPAVELTVSGPRTVRNRTAAATVGGLEQLVEVCVEVGRAAEPGDPRDGLLPEDPQLAQDAEQVRLHRFGRVGLEAAGDDREDAIRLPRHAQRGERPTREKVLRSRDLSASGSGCRGRPGGGRR